MQRMPLACGCTHEARFGDLVRDGRPFTEAVAGGFCAESKRRSNVMCAHSTGSGVTADVYEREVHALIALGVTDETYLQRVRSSHDHIIKIDSDAGIAQRAGTLDEAAVRMRQAPVIGELLRVREELLQIIDNTLEKRGK